MSGPKHLWSGGWEQESGRGGEPRTDWPTPPAGEPEAASPPRRPRPTASRAFAYFLVALVLVLGAGIALASALGGSSRKHPSRAQQTVPATGPTTATTPAIGGPSGGAPVQAAPIAGGPTANWLGMQIVSTQSGAVVNTVRLGSAGDAAGFQPGDVIAAVDGRQINTVPQIRSATSGLRVGATVKVEVDRGSTTLALGFTMRARPTIQP